MWPQNWSPLLPLLLDDNVDLNRRYSSMNLTVSDLMRLADTFYTSLGLPAMPAGFWIHSQTDRVKGHRNAHCHPVAVNMFADNDYRMLMCGTSTLRDLHVVHHEMGHIHYFMAYNHLPVIFQDGASPSFHEAVGDSIMLGVMSPAHLSRIGFWGSSLPSDHDVELALLLHSALSHLPQLLFALTLESWRWKVMDGTIPPEVYNKVWWDLMYCIMGIEPPMDRDPAGIDAASKYHVLANIPYIQYYLSEFLQVQIFEAMCFAANQEKGRPSHGVPLHKCDIYGSKKAGLLLKRMMEVGASGRWEEVLLNLTSGRYSGYSAQPLLDYYRPLVSWIDQQIDLYQIPVWDKTRV